MQFSCQMPQKLPKNGNFNIIKALRTHTRNKIMNARALDYLFSTMRSAIEHRMAQYAGSRLQSAGVPVNGLP